MFSQLLPAVVAGIGDFPAEGWLGPRRIQKAIEIKQSALGMKKTMPEKRMLNNW